MKDDAAASVPGYIGARSVKWLRRISLQPAPSENYFQARAYKLFPPHLRPDQVDREAGQMLGELPVNAVICTPHEGARVSGAGVAVQGMRSRARVINVNSEYDHPAVERRRVFARLARRVGTLSPAAAGAFILIPRAFPPPEQAPFAN